MGCFAAGSVVLHRTNPFAPSPRRASTVLDRQAESTGVPRQVNCIPARERAARSAASHLVAESVWFAMRAPHIRLRPTWSAGVLGLGSGGDRCLARLASCCLCPTSVPPGFNCSAPRVCGVPNFCWVSQDQLCSGCGGGRTSDQTRNNFGTFHDGVCLLGTNSWQPRNGEVTDEDFT